jgi:hypothetical protein
MYNKQNMKFNEEFTGVELAIGKTNKPHNASNVKQAGQHLLLTNKF